MSCRSKEFRKERPEISCRKSMTNFEVQNECAVAYSKYLLTTGYFLARWQKGLVIMLEKSPSNNNVENYGLFYCSKPTSIITTNGCDKQL